MGPDQAVDAGRSGPRPIRARTQTREQLLSLPVNKANPGQLIVIAGRPDHGSLHPRPEPAALRGRQSTTCPAAYFALESRRTDITMRLLVARGPRRPAPHAHRHHDRRGLEPPRQRDAQRLRDPALPPGRPYANLTQCMRARCEVDPELNGRQREGVGVLREASRSAMRELRREAVGILRNDAEMPGPVRRKPGPPSGPCRGFCRRAGRVVAGGGRDSGTAPLRRRADPSPPLSTGRRTASLRRD
ncbi:hypothetical protein STENM327S_00595 [Streptomyces tendae]